LTILSLQTYSQTYELKGVVVDSLDNPIPFATLEILKAEGGIGVACNHQGKFVLAIPRLFSKDSITISALGYSTKKIPLFNLQSDVRIKLAPESYNLPEVVIKSPKSQNVELGIKETSEWTGGIYMIATELY
jgi:hypothetical protein